MTLPPPRLLVAVIVVAAISIPGLTAAHQPSYRTGNPVANQAAVVTVGAARFTVLTARLLRLEFSPHSPARWNNDATVVVWNRYFATVPKFNVSTTTHGSTIIDTGALTLTYSPSRSDTGFTATNLNIQLATPGVDGSASWSFGAPDSGNLFGTIRTLDNLNATQNMNCSQHQPWVIHNEPEHCTMGLVSTSGWATFSDAHSPIFVNDWVAPQTLGVCPATTPKDATPCFGAGWNRANATSCEAAGCCWMASGSAAGSSTQCIRRTGYTDTYFLGHGPAYTAALADFASIAGRQPVPRRHMLGICWSKWGNLLNDTVTRMQVAALAKAQLPVDTYIFDMDWHLEKLPQVTWTGYTWDPAMFPDPAGITAFLHSYGLATGANLHDASGVMPFEQRYEAMARANGVDPTTHDTVSFHISDKTYADSLNELVLQPLNKQGLDFWWTDWQQGMRGVLDISGLNPTMMLNHYRFTRVNPTIAPVPGGGTLRGQILSRFGGLGAHRYAVGFGGDVQQSWESLQFMVYFTSTASNVLFEMMADYNAGWTDWSLQLFTRVMQFGAFSPIFTNYGNVAQDDNTWLLPPPFFNATRTALTARNRLLPYRYTLARVGHETAVSSVRPMYYAHPWISDAYNAPHQYMLGPELLVAPAVTPMAAGGDEATVAVWFPPDVSWVRTSFGRDECAERGMHTVYSAPPADQASARSKQRLGPGGVWHNVTATIDEVPVFARAGAIVPLLPAPQAAQLGAASRSYTHLQFDLFCDQGAPSGTAGVCPGLRSSWLYEDDGLSDAYLKGVYVNTTVTVASSAGCTSVTVASTGAYATMPSQRVLSFRLRSPLQQPSAVTVNGAAISHSTDGGCGRCPASQAGSSSWSVLRDGDILACITNTAVASATTFSFCN